MYIWQLLNQITSYLFLCGLLDVCGCRPSKVWTLNHVTADIKFTMLSSKNQNQIGNLGFFPQNLSEPTAKKNFGTITTLLLHAVTTNCCHTTTNHLICQQQGSLKAELSWTKVEEIFQTWPKQLHYHDIVVAFCAPPFHRRNAHCNSNTSATDGQIPNHYVSAKWQIAHL